MKKRLVIFHPAIAPYRIDFFNSLQEIFETSFYFLHKDALEQSFNQDKLKEKLHFTPNYLKPGCLGLNNLRLDIFSILRKEKPDIVFCSEYNLLGLLLLLYKSFFNRKLKIITLCDENIEMAQSAKGKQKWFRSFLVKYFQGVILANEAVVDYYVNTFHSQTKFIYFPIIQKDRIFRKYLSESIPSSRHYAGLFNLINKQVLLYVGRLDPVKNIPLLLKSFASVSSQYQNAILIIVGEGKDFAALKNEVSAQGIEERVIFTGKKQGTELYGLYNLGQIFVLPSIYEPFGAVINEALLSGCFTLCSSVAGSACLIRNGQNGYIFDPHSEINLTQKLEKALKQCNLLTSIEVKSNQMLQDYQVHMDCFIKQLRELL